MIGAKFSAGAEVRAGATAPTPVYIYIHGETQIMILKIVQLVQL